MTLDARALVMLARRSPGYELIVDAIARDAAPRTCATALAEAAILLHATGDTRAELTVQSLVHGLNITVVPFIEGDWKAAIRAYKEASRTDTPPPTLGRCLSAAVAEKTNSPLVDT
jgi:uncharacterized protein with PIN domain